MGYLIKSTIDGTSVTGTANTITSSVLIVANGLTVGDIFEVNFGFSKLVATATLSVRLYINTSNSLTGATQLTLYGTTAALFAGCLGRILYIKNATDTQLYTTTASTATNPDTLALANTSLNIDWTVSQYLIVALNHSSGTSNNSFSTFLLGLKR
tara:strand:+ start:1025 stop:1489 length:465 start_codon:yes stop_codon:yes gene_type:complete